MTAPYCAIAVTDRATGDRRYCCRPGVRPDCFGAVVRTADRDAIRLLVNDPRETRRPEPIAPPAGADAMLSPSARRWRTRHGFPIEGRP